MEKEHTSLRQEFNERYKRDFLDKLPDNKEIERRFYEMKARFESSQPISEIRNPLIENLIARLTMTKEKMQNQ